MSRSARLAGLLALAAALCCRLPSFADSPASAHFTTARMFNPVAESLLADLFTEPAKDLSPIAIALFHTRNVIVVSMASPVPATPSGSVTISAVNLHAFAAPARLPDRPLNAPSVTPVVPPAHAQIAQAAVSATPDVPVVRFGTYTPYVPPLQTMSEDVQVPVRIGGVHFSGLVSGAQAQALHTDAVRAMQLCGTTDEAAACPYLHDTRTQSVAAGTGFNVRAGNTQLDFQFTGSVGRVSNGDAAVYQYSPLDPDTQLDTARAGSPQDSSLLYYPGLTEIVRHGLNARLAVPISPVVTLGLQYDRAHYQGNYGTLLAPGLDATKDTYLGNVTYQLPNSSSLITLSARQYRYQDAFAPNFNLTETRADLSLTVKF